MPAAATPLTFVDYLRGLPTCDHEPEQDFYYRTEAADRWQQYFSSEFTVRCRNPGPGPHQDLTKNAVLSTAAASQGLVHVFYYYTPFTYAQSQIAKHHRWCIATQTGLISSTKHSMALCFLARYRTSTPALVGRASHTDGTQNDQQCRFILCDPACLTIPREDIQLYLQGHWYPLPAITDSTLGKLMVTWRDDAQLCGPRASTLMQAVQA